ncbi:hypothetical protein LINPERPRIM_LOCUS2022 [Linum perenne]
MVQIRDRTISIASSYGRFGSDFKLEVARSTSSHFVFVEAAQLGWLEGVLSTAESSNWAFPDSCVVKSDRRSIRVSRFNCRGIPMLKVEEVCVSGQTFFVLIPAESSLGWSNLARKLREFLEIKPNKSLVEAGKSFASVVVGTPFPLAGRCSESILEGEKVIVVEEEGVQARRDYLSRCLVMRFVGVSPLRWDEFRVWMAKAWGIPQESIFSPIGDDLWMLKVSSVTVARRIMALKRWKFKGWNILMDVWTETAGRSRYVENSNEAWVVVRGIPLHLRSMELFRHIGEFCGGFIGAEDGLSLSTVRLKVQRNTLIPEEVPICSGSEVFLVSIEAEAPTPLPLLGLRSTFLARWKAKRKGLTFQISRPEVEVSSVKQIFSSSGSGGFDQAKSLRVAGESSEKAGGLQKACDLTGVLGVTNEVPFCSTKEFSVVEMVLNYSGLTDKEDCREKGGGVGLNYQDKQNEGSDVANKKEGKEVLSLFPQTEMSVGPTSKPDLFDGPNQEPRGPPSQNTYTPPQEVVLNKGLVNNLSLFALPTDEIRNCSDSEVSEDEFDHRVQPKVQIDVVPIKSLPLKKDNGLPPIEERSEKELELLVREVAADIGLEMNGSRSDGEGAAVKVCKEVLKRRPPKTPSSKTDREHKRLGVIGLFDAYTPSLASTY